MHQFNFEARQRISIGLFFPLPWNEIGIAFQNQAANMGGLQRLDVLLTQLLLLHTSQLCRFSM